MVARHPTDAKPFLNYPVPGRNVNAHLTNLPVQSDNLSRYKSTE